MPSKAKDSHVDDLRRLMQRLFRRFGALAVDTTPCGQPLSMAHGHALLVLLAQGELSQLELGRELCIDKSNVARLCARMVEAGHLVQKQSRQDGRSRRVSLTARGKRMALEVDESSGARFGALLAGLGPTQRPRVLEALRHLVTALDALPSRTTNERTPR